MKVELQARRGLHCVPLDDGDLLLAASFVVPRAVVRDLLRDMSHRASDALRDLEPPLSRAPAGAPVDSAARRPANDGAGRDDAPRVPEAIDLALAAESVLQTFRVHRQVMLGSPDWTERDRAAFAVLERAVGRFWARDRGGA